MVETPSRPRRRTLVWLFVALVGILALALGADAVARVVAERVLARTVQDQIGVDERPEVQLGGGLFLPQVLRGRYDAADVGISGLTSGSLRIEQVDSHLTDVQVPLRDLLARDVRRVDIGAAHEEVTLTYPELNRYLAGNGLPVTLSAAGSEQLDVTGSLDLLGRQVDARATVALALGDQELLVTPTQIGVDVDGLDQPRELELRRRLTFPLPLDTLPFGLQLTRVTTAEQGVRIEADGQNIVVRP